MAHTILRLPAVKARTGLSRSTIYLHVAMGSFPRQVSLGARAVGWLESEVEAWLAGRIQNRELRDSERTSLHDAELNEKWIAKQR